MPIIAVDAMGGDFAPEDVVKGVAQVSLQTDIECLVVGDEQQIQAVLDRVPYNPERIAIHHTDEFVTMVDDTMMSPRHRRRTSIMVAARLVTEGQAHAVVTAGNTAAALAACAQHFKIINGLRRVALSGVYPRQTVYPGQDQLALLLDVGATVRCDAIDLARFAVMGSAYARHVSKTPDPRVALLNMGVEETKGGEVLADAYRRLKAIPEVNFVGNIEGNELTKGTADVIVCEGLLGNVVLKLLGAMVEVVADSEGAVRRERWRRKLGAFMMESGGGRFRDLLAYEGYGGAPVLGFDQLMLKLHSRADVRSVENAIKVSAKAVRSGVIREIVAGIERW
jgi:glycerol-3-phosphate acyltransferase PlsX